MAERQYIFPDERKEYGTPVEEYDTMHDQPTRREPQRRIVRAHVMSEFDKRAFRYWRDSDPDRYNREKARFVASHGYDPGEVIDEPSRACSTRS